MAEDNDRVGKKGQLLKSLEATFNWFSVIAALVGVSFTDCGSSATGRKPIWRGLEI